MASHYKEALVNKLYTDPPSRKDLTFQVIEGLPAIKALHGPDLANDKEMHNLFCMVHSEFVPQSGIDIEHAFSHSHIKGNQERLLQYLNSDLELTKPFLAEPGMTDFFRINAGRVKGTGYFYKICYNDADNLW